MKRLERKSFAFKDHLKQMLMRHSFRPALQMEVICVLLVVCIGSVWGTLQSRQTSSAICDTLEETVFVYDRLLEELVTTEKITDAGISSTRRTAIMKALYTATIRSGYDAELYILDANGKAVVSSREELTEEEQNEISRNWRILEKMKEHPEKLQTEVSRGSERTWFLGRAVEQEGCFLGYAVIKINGKAFDRLLASHSPKVAIVQEDYWVLESDGYQFVDPIGKLNTGMRGFRGLCVCERGIYYIMHQTIPCGALTVYTFFDYTDALRVLLTVVFTGAVVLCLLFFAGQSNTEKLAVKATEDIRVLNAAFLEVADGNLNVRTDMHSSTEFETIGQGFNQMLDSLKHQMERNRELAEAVAYEQVKQLASQFKSHFLFNTLDNIRFACRLEPELAENMVVSLSELLRYNTGNPNEKVTIAEDLNYIRLYFDILKFRFGEGFDYHIQVAEEVKECLVLKLLVQPLVENAVKYGFGDRDHMEIFITAERAGNCVRIACQDDGEGIRPELLERIRANLAEQENRTPHLGLYNVHRRLQLTYGQEYGLQLENVGGLKVTVTFPIETEAENIEQERAE